MSPGPAAPGDEAAAGDFGEAVPSDLGDLGDFESLIVLVNFSFVRRGSAERGKGSATRRKLPKAGNVFKGLPRKTSDGTTSRNKGAYLPGWLTACSCGGSCMHAMSRLADVFDHCAHQCPRFASQLTLLHSKHTMAPFFFSPSYFFFFFFFCLIPNLLNLLAAALKCVVLLCRSPPQRLSPKSP
jgi:hypothetical protein